MKILMILTSHEELGNSGDKTGFWIEEFAAPYYVFADASAEITIASPKGGQPPVDPKSEAPDAQTDATSRFYKDAVAIDKVAHSLVLGQVTAADYDAVFYPGGHGPLWDLANDTHSIALIEQFYNEKKPVGLVCHAPAALVNTKDQNGEPLVKGKQVTGFSNEEEAAVQLTDIVPFLLEDKLKELGADYSKGEQWSSYTQHDGLLFTGQNPGSSAATAQLVADALRK